jgi:hypothetical protein
VPRKRKATEKLELADRRQEGRKEGRKEGRHMDRKSRKKITFET